MTKHSPIFSILPELSPQKRNVNLPIEQVFPLVPLFPGENLGLLLPGVQSILRSLKELVLVFVSLGKEWHYDGLRGLFLESWEACLWLI